MSLRYIKSILEIVRLESMHITKHAQLGLPRKFNFIGLSACHFFFKFTRKKAALFLLKKDTMSCENFDQVLSNVQAASTQLLNHVNVLKNKFSSLDEIESNISALDASKLHTSLAFAYASLYFAHLRCNGVNTENHFFEADLNRVKLYTTQVYNLQKELDEMKNETHLTLDKEASRRILRACINRNLC